MDSNVKISVVIPAYNVQNSIISCLNSVLAQTINISEIIIINDGSTDTTEKVCLEYKKLKHLDNLKVISQINSGPSKARNVGVKESTGNWIAFIDSDDKWKPEKVEKQLAILEQNPDCKLIGTLKHNESKNISLITLYNKITFRSMLFKNSFFTSSVIIQKDIFMKFRFDELKKYAEDYKLWLQVIYSYKGLVLNEGLIYYGIPDKKEKQKSLSSKLWKMEMGVLDNFCFLYKMKMINIFEFLFATSFSFIKFQRRIVKYILNTI